MPSPGRLGRAGEFIALLVLLCKGYRLRNRNWRGAGGEIDLVMEKGRDVVMVEVKARSDSGFGGALAAVNKKKQQVLTRTAAAYLSRYNLWQRPCRFDVVTIEKTVAFPFWRVQHLQGAFQADLGRTI